MSSVIDRGRVKNLTGNDGPVIDQAVRFDRQRVVLKEWIQIWSEETRRVFLEKLLSRCNGEQLKFLFSVTEPMYHRGFIYSARVMIPSCTPLSTPSSREEALQFASQNLLGKYHRPESALLQSRDDMDTVVQPIILPPIDDKYGKGVGLYKEKCKRKAKSSAEQQTKTVLGWYDSLWTDREKHDALYAVLCHLTVHELYLTTVILSMRMYRDFISQLEETLALKILGYLEPKDIVNATQVSKRWYELCNSDSLWAVKCTQVSIDMPISSSKPWKSIFKNNVFLHRNWISGRCRVYSFSGHNNRVVTVAYEVKTGKIATGSSSTIKIWNQSKSGVTGRGGNLIVTLTSHTKAVWSLQWYRPNCLLSGSSDGTIKIWNIKKGLCQKSIEAHAGSVWVIQCYNDTIFSGSADKLIKCWDIKRCECVATYSGHTGSVFSLAIVEDTDTFISGSADKTIRLWNITTEACLRVLWPTHSNPGWVMSLSVSNGHVACAYNDKVVIYHISTGVVVRKFEAHTAPVECVCLQMTGASDGILVTSSKDKTIKYWSVADGAHHTLVGHKAAVHGVHYDPTKIISTSSDGSMRIWSFEDCPDTNRRKTVIAGGMGEATMYEFSHDENVKYESRQTKLYKKHLKKIQNNKNGVEGSSAEEDESGDDNEPVERNPNM